MSIALGLAFAVTSIPIRTELPLLLPSSGSISQQLFVDQLQSGPASRILLLGIQGAEPSILAKASKELASAMRSHEQILHVHNGEQTKRTPNLDFLYQYRYLLSPTVSPDQFTSTGLRKSLQHRLQDLANPLPAFFKKRIPEDPTGTFQGILNIWKSTARVKVAHGVWFSSKQPIALLVAETTVGGFDLDAQEAIQTFLTTTMESIRAKLSSSASLALIRSGPAVFAVQSRTVIKGDAKWLSLLGTGLVITLLLLTYRSLSILFLSLVPLVTGLLIAGITVFLTFDFIHGMTLAFGATLIGVAIDYPLHACSHLESEHSAKQAIMGVWPTIRLGATTTAIGYGAMLFSSFPGLSQLGLFAIVGLLSAAVTTRWLLPLLVPKNAKATILWAKWLPLQHVGGKLGIILIPICIVLSLSYLVLSEKPFWEMDIANISPVPKNLRDRDAWLRKDLGAPAVRDMIVVVAPNAQKVLEQSEELKTTLEQLINHGHMAGYEMAADYLPSIRLQKLRQETLPDHTTLRSHLKEAQRDLPFKFGLFDPFVQSITTTKSLQPLEIETIHGTPLHTKIRSLLYPLHNRWVGTILIRDVKNREAIQQTIHTEARPSVHYLDLKYESNHMVSTYRQEVLAYLAIGMGCLIVILGLGLQSVGKVAFVIFPIAGSIMLDLSILHALGERLSLFHLAALLLVFGIGLDYTLFFQRAHATTMERQQTISAIMVCSLTTIAVFGLLACSQTPVLRGIGLTVFFGSLSCFLFAAMCSPSPNPKAT